MTISKNPRTIIAAATLAVLGATGAVAQGAQMASGDGPLSRSEVVAELRAAQAAGWQPIQEVSPTPLQAIEQERKEFSMGTTYRNEVPRDRSMSGSSDPSMKSPNQDETRSLQNVPNQRVPAQ